MILSQIPPKSSLPGAKSSWKTTRVEDVVGLIKILEGKDPAWRFLEMRQIDEIRRNLGQLVSTSHWRGALQGQAAALKMVKEALELAHTGVTPPLAREMCVAQNAQERLARWAAHKTTDFEDAPMGLKLLLNARTRPSSRRLIDNAGIAITPILKHGIRHAEKAGWIITDRSKGSVPSQEAKERLIGLFKSSVVRPVGGESLAAILKVPPTDTVALGRAVCKLAESDLEFLAKPVAKASETLNASTTTGVSSNEPLIAHALEMLELRARRGAPREQIINSVALALSTLGDQTSKRSKGASDLLTKAAEACLPQDPTGSKIGAAEYYMSAWAPHLRSLKFGFSDLLPAMKFYLTCSDLGSHMRDTRGFTLQREVLSLAAEWLSREDIATEITRDLKQILVRGTSPYGSRLSIENALFGIMRNHKLFTSEQLKGITLNVLSNEERNFSHHSLYISAKSVRSEGRVQAMGALEMVIELIRAGRLGSSEASEAYRYAGHYKVRRDRERCCGLWMVQRAETEVLMEELNQLAGGEPKSAWERELTEMAEQFRVTRNEKVRVSKARADRMRRLAGKVMERVRNR